QCLIVFILKMYLMDQVPEDKLSHVNILNKKIKIKIKGNLSDNDMDSLFTIKFGQGQPVQTYNSPVKCGDIIRLEHINTKKNLHSHNYKSAISNKQEVSGFGNNGQGDLNDNFIIECINGQKGSDLLASFEFYLQHQLSKLYLSSSKRFNYNRSNCGYNCPIIDQLEVNCQSNKDADSKWKVVGGLILQKSQWQNNNVDDSYDDEVYEQPQNKEQLDDEVYEEVQFKKITDL
ncbi:stromal cell-derived factor 2, putative, partial [Ichthyophthirius multifiliis]